MKNVTQAYTALMRLSVRWLVLIVLVGCNMIDSAQDLPLFDPYAKEFACAIEATRTPPIDAEADEWFRQALALEDALELEESPDYTAVVALTRKAAERHHWKAMLNLANLYLQGRDPAYGQTHAVQVVRKAMDLGVPAAYDRMGTFHLNGTGVIQDATRAYAYFQKAARMGNPNSMYFLGRRMNVGPHSERPGYWANKSLALKMFECAFSQGHGDAALELYFSYRYPRDKTGYVIGGATPATKDRALKMLHAGVMLGCIDCADTLSVEFDSPINGTQSVIPHIDKSRAERYGVLADALRYRRNRRFPNLDNVLPLPPQELPTWDGAAATLINAAMGVHPKKSAVIKKDVTQQEARFYVHPLYDLCRTGETTTAAVAPCGGYWRPTSVNGSARFKEELSRLTAGVYTAGEHFERHLVADANKNDSESVVWERWLTVRNNNGAVDPVAAEGLTRQAHHDGCLVESVVGNTCPATGIWQPWVKRSHPLEQLINQPWRQVWLHKDQRFPDPIHDWLLAIPQQDIAWHHMEASYPRVSRPSATEEV